MSAAPPNLCPVCSARLEQDGVCLVCLLQEGLEADHITGQEGATPTPSARSLLLPCEFAGYRLVREIASGGMGIVYEAEDVKLRRVVAMKVVRNAHFATREEAARFRAETQAVAQLDHPDIIPLYESGEEEGVPYFTMRLAEGGSLADRLKKRGVMPDREAATFLSRIARAVQHAHGHGVLHRDLKPANILLDMAGKPMLSDFGLAKLLDAEFQLTRSNAYVGTPHFMSPEQAAGKSKEVTTASDVWALGVILYQMLTDKLPFQGGSAVEVMRRITQEQPEISSSGKLTVRTGSKSGDVKPTNVSASSLQRVQPDLATLILRCLEKQPARRLPSAGFLADELDRFLNGKPLQSRPVGAFERLWKLTLRNKAAALAILGVSLSLLAGSGVSLWQMLKAQEAERMALQQKAESDEMSSIILDTAKGLDEHLVGREVDADQFRAELLRRVSAFQGDPLRKASMLENLSTMLKEPTDLQLFRELLAQVEPQLDADDPLLWSMRYRVALKAMHFPGVVGAAARELHDELRQIIAWQAAHLAADDKNLYKTKFALADGLIREGEGQAALQEAEALLRSCIAEYEKNNDWFDIITVRIELMTAIFGQGRQAEALKLGRETCAQALKEFGERHAITGRGFGRFAKHCREAGLVAESLQSGARALDIYWHTVGPDYVKARSTLSAQSATLVKSGDLAGNLELMRAAVKVCDQQLGPVHSYTLQRVERLIETLRQMPLLEEAQAQGRLWLERVRLNEGLLPPAATGLLVQQALTLLKLERQAEAMVSLQELPALMARMNDDLTVLARLVPLAEALLEHDQPTEAGTILRRVITVFEQRQGEEPELAATVLPRAKQQMERAEQALAAAAAAGR